MKSRAGPDAGEGATQERRGSDREAVLLFSLPLPASSPFPTLGSQTQSQGLIHGYGYVVFGLGNDFTGKILHQIPRVQIILD